MCGIAVAVDWDNAEFEIGRILGGLIHRGDVTDPVAAPRPRMAMGTRRLRIVDAEGGAQPKLSSNGRILVSFNGEIYNHRELRRELAALGSRFETESDTEVLADALSVWGPAALSRIEGMYAFVAIDVDAGEFLAARDPFGVKPLYLIRRGEGYLFASEIGPLLGACGEGDVLPLPPGHVLTRRGLHRFGTRGAQAPRAPIAGDAGTLDRLMREAIHSRAPPDLPFAMLFSGGLDSTLIAHYAREIRPDAPGYFLGRADAPDYGYAAGYAEMSGLDLRLVDVSAPRLQTRAHLTSVISTLEAFEPSVVRDALCNHALFEAIHADGFRVALSGEGADELFAGYLPLEIAFAHGRAAGDYVRDQTLNNMGPTNLQRLDRCGMRFQIEAREPMLDSRLAAYALSLSAEALVEGAGARKTGKRPLRQLWDLYPDRLPEAIRTRRKLALHVGSGLDKSQNASPWIDFAEAEVSDAEFRAGRREFAPFALASKEEYLYLRILSEQIDVTRTPHLVRRPFLRFPRLDLGPEAIADLADFLAAA